MIRGLFFITFFGVLVGIVASLASIVFVELIKILGQALRTLSGSHPEPASNPVYILIAILVPTVAGLIVGILSFVTQEKRPLSIVDTIESAQSMRFITPIKSGFISALASVVSIGGGASVGQYGPLANMGATLGGWISRITYSIDFTPTMGIGCGAAAAIATAFNAPIAGLLFAHEVILRHYSLSAFAPITVSAVTGYIIANYVFELPPLFQVQFLTPIQSLEFLVFIVIGLGGACIAALLIKLVFFSADISARLRLPSYVKPALAGGLLGVVSIWLPEVLGIGDDVIRQVMISGFSNSEMLTIFLLRILMTAMCLGFGFAGGIFSPALVIGVLFGAIVGNTVSNLIPIHMIDYLSSITVYSICGMVAVASPVIGAPLTAILIIFELTRNYDLTIAAMVSVVFANLLGYRLVGRSIFDVQLKRIGFDLGLGRDKVVLASRSISEFLSDDYVASFPDTKLIDVKKMLVDSEKSEAYVLDEERRYIGTLSLVQLIKLENEGLLLDQSCRLFVTPEQIIFTPQTTIWAAMEQVQAFVGESIPVISGFDNKVFKGVVYEASIINAYMTTLHRVRKEEYGVE